MPKNSGRPPPSTYIPSNSGNSRVRTSSLGLDGAERVIGWRTRCPAFGAPTDATSETRPSWISWRGKNCGNEA